MFGEKIVMRLLNKSSAHYKLTDLGFDEEEMSYFNDLIVKPHGIILITGPTGSGKSTTLIAALGKMATESVNVMTVEDPVEYQLDRINQVHVNAKVGLTFATALRTFMRQDPDIIMVGEIRDYETADLAVNAALTGHLVFSTLHTNDAPGAVPRINNLGIPPFLINASVIGIMGQRLVRKLCQHCKQSYQPSAEELDLIRGAYNPAEHGDKILMYSGKGCKFCNHLGYSGRIGIVRDHADDQRAARPDHAFHRDPRSQAPGAPAGHEDAVGIRREEGAARHDIAGGTAARGTPGLRRGHRARRIWPGSRRHRRGFLAEAAPTLAEVETFSAL